MSPAELGNLSQQLVALAPEVGALTPAQTTFASQQLYPVSRCFSQVLHPRRATSSCRTPAGRPVPPTTRSCGTRWSD